ncbi:MAG TPA: anti-sigma regulatory factor [Gemmatimonadales bacterium]|nr:anti-sigma regulatory factor [Gemmatimonadales bacterium]
MDAERLVPIRADVDIVTARQESRRLASTLGFSTGDLTVIAAAVSEVARNILAYAAQGEVDIKVVERNGRRGVLVIARDQGPGIPDVALALQDGFSTSGSLGLGLPGARRLMDEFELSSELGRGTVVTMRKWAR